MKDKDLVDNMAEAADMTLACDVMGAEEVAQFPSLIGESPKNQMILCATACGYSQNFIAKMFDVSQPYINKVLKKVDPNGMFRISPKARKAFITRLAETRGMEALSSITPEKIEESSAKDLMKIAKDYVAISRDLNQSKHKEIGKSRLDNILQAIEHDVEVSGPAYEE